MEKNCQSTIYYDDYLQISNAIDDYINGYLLICKLINYHQHSSTIYLLCIYYDDLINYQSNVAIKWTMVDHDQLWWLWLWCIPIQCSWFESRPWLCDLPMINDLMGRWGISHDATWLVATGCCFSSLFWLCVVQPPWLSIWYPVTIWLFNIAMEIQHF